MEKGKTKKKPQTTGKKPAGTGRWPEDDVRKKYIANEQIPEEELDRAVIAPKPRK